MAGDSGSIPEHAIRELGRMWGLLVWSVLLVLAAYADFTVLAFAPAASWYPFAAGIATGMVLAGLIISLGREWDASSAVAKRR